MEAIDKGSVLRPLIFFMIINEKNLQDTAVIFDIIQAFDGIWKCGILKKLYKQGIKGNLAFIKNFLYNRPFKIRENGTISQTKTQKIALLKVHLQAQHCFL